MRRCNGLEELMRLLGLDNHQHDQQPAHVLFVSLDLEVSRDHRSAFVQKNIEPDVRELGLAFLNSRDIFSSEPRAVVRRIQTHQFSTLNASTDFEDCDVTNFRECAFARTLRITQSQVARTFNRLISSNLGSSESRKLVLIGHSIKRDWDILQAKGASMEREGLNVTVLDTHSLSHAIFHHLPEKPASFTLSGIMAHLECAHFPYELHNAGNDATFTLYALLRMAAKHSESRQGMPEQVIKNRDAIVAFADHEINQTARWQPIRRSLGAHLVSEETLLEGNSLPQPHFCKGRQPLPP